MSVDIFECEDGRFLINELQSLHGQKTSNLMYINGVPGRYYFKNNKFIFEEGDFTKYQSYLLRVKHFVKILTAQDKREAAYEN